MPDAPPGAADYLRELDAVLARLRDRGYPAPRFRIISRLPRLVFWVQPRACPALPWTAASANRITRRWRGCCPRCSGSTTPRPAWAPARTGGAA